MKNTSTTRKILKSMLPQAAVHRLCMIENALAAAPKAAVRAFERFRWSVLRLFFRLPTITLAEIVGTASCALEEVILDDICLPPFYGSATHDDYTPLMTIVNVKKPALVVELGTAQGNLTANICRQAPNASVVTVNAPVEEQTGQIITFTLTRGQIGAVYRNHGFQGRVKQIYTNTRTLDLGQYVKPGSVDIAIVDACHDREYVLNDFHKVKSYVREGGIVLLHDTHPDMRWHLAGSYSACMLLRAIGYDLRHLKDTWWGVWIRPGERHGKDGTPSRARG